MTTPPRLYRETPITKGKLVSISFKEWIEEPIEEWVKIEGLFYAAWTPEYLYEILKEVN